MIAAGRTSSRQRATAPYSRSSSSARGARRWTIRGKCGVWGTPKAPTMRAKSLRGRRPIHHVYYGGMTDGGRFPATTTRTAVVTGGAASIGQAFARRLAQDGHRVAIADLAPADETVAMVNDAGSEALAAVCDVSSGESGRAFPHAGPQR